MTCKSRLIVVLRPTSAFLCGDGMIKFKAYMKWKFCYVLPRLSFAAATVSCTANRSFDEYPNIWDDESFDKFCLVARPFCGARAGLSLNLNVFRVTHFWVPKSDFRSPLNIENRPSVNHFHVSLSITSNVIEGP